MTSIDEMPGSPVTGRAFSAPPPPVAAASDETPMMTLPTRSHRHAAFFMTLFLLTSTAQVYRRHGRDAAAVVRDTEAPVLERVGQQIPHRLTVGSAGMQAVARHQVHDVLPMR